MKLLSKERNIEANLRGLCLVDILDKLKDENFFNYEKGFYLIQVVDKNQIIFGVPRNKVTPKEIHNFTYSEVENKIKIKSNYASWFFPSMISFIMPFLPIFLGWKELQMKEWKIIAAVTLGITLFISIFAFTSLNENSKHIERELTIRINFLLRKKGYRTGI